MKFHADKDAATLTATTPSLLATAEPEAPGAAAEPNPAPETRKLNLRPLASLVPYIKRYRWRRSGH